MSSYLRCRHCRGFYEIALSHCRYCGKDLPQKNADGSDQVFPDRETCRAIQIAEFERLPPEAHDDPFQPDPAMLDKRCYCLHCGPDGGLFEAVEMRWMVNEHMWACPCTTCGGRGFSFDVHLVERFWQCAECQHFYTPAGNDFRASNAKCPKCGSKHASGWFDDEYSVDEEFDGDEFEGMENDGALGDAAADEEDGAIAEEALPWDDEQVAERRAAAAASPEGEPEALRDDIDFPYDRGRPGEESGREKGGEAGGEAGEINEDDIPW